MAEGVDVVVATCTGGERGSILNPAMDRPDILANIADIRRQEMDRAREILGIKQVWLGFVDSGLPEGDDPPPLPEGCFARTDIAVAAAPLVEVIRSFRPHVMTTYDENAEVTRIRTTSCATRSALRPLRRRPTLMRTLTEALSGNRSSSITRLPFIANGWWRWIGRWSPTASSRRIPNGSVTGPRTPEHAARITTRVGCAEYFDVRDRALLAHATQVDPDGPWFAVPLAVHKSAWPTEEWELVRSLVETTIPEDDLFAGIAVPAASRVPA